MAHSKSAKKRVRQNTTKRLRNRSVKSGLRTTIKKFQTALKSGDAVVAAAALKAVQKDADKTVSKGVLRKGTVSRIKSRLAAKLAAVKPAKAKA